MSQTPVVSVKKDKCEVRDRVLYPCETLLSALEESMHAKGLSELLIYRLDRHPSEISRTAILLRSGEHVKRGIVLNFCPFCGADIGSHLMQKDAPAEAGAE